MMGAVIDDDPGDDSHLAVRSPCDGVRGPTDFNDAQKNEHEEIEARLKPCCNWLCLAAAWRRQGLNRRVICSERQPVKDSNLSWHD